jgi:translation initiation factor 3 subunit C
MTQDSDSSSDEEAESGLTGRSKWLKTATVVTKKEKKVKPVEPKVAKKAKQFVTRKTSEVLVPEDITLADLNQRIQDIIIQRGRRHVDMREIIKHLIALSEAARKFGPQCEVPALYHVIAAHLDMQRNMDSFMSLDDWRRCYSHLMRIMEVLEANPDVRLESIQAEEIMARGATLKEEPTELVNPGIIKVMGNLYSLMTRLDEEYTKGLQKINPHTEEYVERLRMESQLVTLCGLVQRYYERANDLATAAKVALLCIEHIYYKHDSIAYAVKKAQVFASKYGNYSDLHPASLGAAGKSDSSVSHPAAAAGGKPTVEVEAEDNGKFIQELCNKVIYRHGDARVRTRAMLCHIAHHALHDRFFEARDLLLMSHLQDNINLADIPTQILFNRAMVMLGLCAFRAGLIAEAHQCLMEICSGRVKELLAQGIQRFAEKNPEQEKAERRRQIPYHMHINQDLLEACHLISAMLLEVPNMATEETSERTRVISRHFRKHVDMMDRQVFTGPPENTRDHVLVAAKSLSTGDWKRCAQLVLDDLDVWNLIPGDGAVKVKEMLKLKIKCEALRTYLFAYSVHYDSLSLSQLCRMFELDKRTANGVISKMMINQELHASWDQPTETVILHRVEPTHLQALALQYADKAAQLLDCNERFLETRGGGGGKEDWAARNGSRAAPPGGWQGGWTGGKGGKGGKGKGNRWGGGQGGGNNKWGDRNGGGGSKPSGNRWGDRQAGKGKGQNRRF